MLCYQTLSVLFLTYAILIHMAQAGGVLHNSERDHASSPSWTSCRSPAVTPSLTCGSKHPTSIYSSIGPSYSAFGPFTAVATSIHISASTCYPLPTQVSLRKIAMPPGNQTDFIPEAMYMDKNSTKLVYLQSRASSGKSILLDLSSNERVAFTDSNGTAIMIDKRGFHFSTKGCEVVVDLEIANFSEQIKRLAKLVRMQKRGPLHKRFVEKEFKVEVKLTDQCGRPYTGNTWMHVGPTMCLALLPDVGAGKGVYDFQCQFPGEKSGEMVCEEDIRAALNLFTGGVIGDSTNWKGLIVVAVASLERNLGKVMWAALEKELKLALPSVFLQAIPVVGGIWDGAMLALAAYEVYVTIQDVIHEGGLAQKICMEEHEKDFPLPLALELSTASYEVRQLGKNFVPTEPWILASLNVEDRSANCASSSSRPVPIPSSVPTPSPVTGQLPPGNPTGPMWVFSLTNGNRHYYEDPNTLYRQNPAYLIKDPGGNGIAANVECVRTRDTPGGPLLRNDPVYFGYDGNSVSHAQLDSCCFFVFSNDRCFIDDQAVQVESWCGYYPEQVWRLPFNVQSWNVRNCANMFRPNT